MNQYLRLLHGERKYFELSRLRAFDFNENFPPCNILDNRRTGDFTGVLYNGVEDPDCWWSYTTCTTPKIPTIPADIVRCVEPQSYGNCFFLFSVPCSVKVLTFHYKGYTLDDGPNCS